MDLQLLANYKLTFHAYFEVLGHLGWANFLTLKVRIGRSSDLKMLKTKLQLLANYKLSFDAYFEVLVQLGWAT